MNSTCGTLLSFVAMMTLQILVKCVLSQSLGLALRLLFTEKTGHPREVAPYDHIKGKSELQV